jgi:PKD repeat protein
MNRFNKIIIVAFMMVFIPMKHWAQTVNNHFIEIEIAKIDNPDLRYCTLAALANDDNLIYSIDEDNNSVIVSAINDWSDSQLQIYYDRLKAAIDDEFRAYQIADKETQGASFISWKERLPQDLFVLLFRQMLIENPVNRDGNQTCATSDPFCTTDVVSFHIDANPGTVCETGPNYGCMSSFTQRPPFWFHMKIAVGGTFTIRITNTNNNDLDFCAWGPFSDPNTPCTSQLTADKIIDCDSPYNSVQECTIPASSQVGQYYIMVITKWSSGATDVSFSKIANSGPGETDCGILPGIASNDGPYCVGETIHLTVNAQDGASYTWTGPGGFTSTQQNPTRPNCTMNMAGTYTCVTTVGNQSTTATTEVVIYPQPTANFNFTTVCQGSPTQFTSTSTTNPSGQQMTYQWNFGDGQTSTQQNPSHTYASPGTYNVSLNVSCGNGHCTNHITKSVSVYANPVANAGPDQTIPYGSTTQLNGSGGAGTFSFHWEPANMVANPNSQNTQTVVLTQDQTYTLTVSNSQGECVDTDEVTVHIEGSAMTVTAGPDISICQGGSGQIQVNAGGGTGSISYSWTPTTGLSNPNIYNPVASPSQTTTYTCHVSDGQTSQDVSVTVTVNEVIVENEYVSICPDDSYQWHGTIYNAEGSYQFDTVTDQGCDKTLFLHLEHYPTYDETTIEVEVCSGETYNFFGTVYDHSCYQIPHTLQSAHGCDSIVRLNLTVWPEHEVTLKEVSLCPEQLPYNFYGVNYYEDADVTHVDTDIHGCDSTVRLLLTVSEYYIPEPTVVYTCDDSYTWNPIGSYHFTFSETGFYTDTLPTDNCDGIFRLDLHFQQVPEVSVENVTSCDSYTWPMTGQTFTQSGDYYHSVSLYPFPCEQVYQLHLTINTQSLLPSMHLSDSCDHVLVSWFGQDTVFYENTSYMFTGLTDEGCYREQTYYIDNMQYTPQTNGIRCQDADAVVYGDTIAVVTNTEFFSFQYTFYVAETGHSQCVWDSCLWNISKPSWTIEFNPVPSIANGRYYSQCKVFVADRQTDHVVLTATVKNDCGTKVNTFYLKSSFLDIDDNNNAPANVTIVPNPNNGQMHIDFENMHGRTAVKVFDMIGNQIDTFETNVSSSQYNYDYSMKNHADGLYFFVISNNNQMLTKKVVIIH